MKSKSPQRTCEITSMRLQNIRCSDPERHSSFELDECEFKRGSSYWLKSEVEGDRTRALKIIAALNFDYEGQYWIDQMNVREIPFEEFLPYRLAIGYGFSQGGLLSNRTLIDNLLLPLLYHRILSTQEAHRKVDKIIEIFGLRKLAHQRPADVPGGVRKLVCGLRSFMTEPQVILLDEPAMGLSPQHRDQFFQFLKDYLVRVSPICVISSEQNILAGFTPVSEIVLHPIGSRSKERRAA